MNKEKVLNFLRDRIGIFVMNIIIFVALFFLIPLLFNHVNPFIWRLLFVLVIIGVTDAFYLTKKIKYDDVLYSIIVLFIFNLIFLDYCTIQDLYGITSHGSLDKCPAILDALLVDIVIVFIEYITLLMTRMFKRLFTKPKKEAEETKEEKKETKKKTSTKKTTSKKSK